MNWNGNPRATTVTNASQLMAAILASDVVSPGTAYVSVSNPAPGGGTSDVLSFEITTPTATLSFGNSEFFTATNPKSLVVADFNKDGRLDIATANQISNTVSVLVHTLPTQGESSPGPVLNIRPPSQERTRASWPRWGRRTALCSKRQLLPSIKATRQTKRGSFGTSIEAACRQLSLECPARNRFGDHYF